MNPITLIILIFFILGALDKLVGDKFGLGKEFSRGFILFEAMALSMLGMLTVAPAIGHWLTPFFEWFYDCFGIEPSIIPSTLFANDMGAESISESIRKSEVIGDFCAYVVASMMGATISYTIPSSISIVKKEQQPDMLLGLLSGIVTVPVGCFISGLMIGIDALTIIVTLLPLIIFSLVIVAGLLFITKICIKIFSVFGQAIRCISIIGLGLAAFTLLSKTEIYEHFDSFEHSALICAKATVSLAGALTLMCVISRLFSKPIEKIGAKVGLDPASTLGFLTTIVSNTPMFSTMDKMNRKGVILNSAFAVSAAFTLGGHLAFTLDKCPDFIMPVVVGKIISGIAAVALALMIYKLKEEKA